MLPPGRLNHRRLQFRGYVQDQVARVWMIRGLSLLGTKFEIDINENPKVPRDLLRCGPLEGNHISGVDNFTVKYPGVVVELDPPNIACVLHHGCTPASVRNLRTDLTAPLSVSCCG